MKSLATCTPSEFLKQTNRIRKAVEKWLSITDIVKIYNTRATLTPFRNDMSEEERLETFAANKKASNDQMRDNLSRIFDEVMEKHPDETLVLLGLCCFVEPEDIDNHTVDEYLEALTELLNNKAVFNFFTSLMRLEQSNTPSASPQ